MPFCPNCGAEAVESAKFCTACGQQLRKGRLQPSQELLNEVRTMAAYLAGIPAEIQAQMRADFRRDFLVKAEGLRTQLEDSLGTTQVSIHVRPVTRGPFGILVATRKLMYQVTERSIVRLEFVDWVGETGRTLEAVRKYQHGTWEHTLHSAYRKCLDLYNEREKVHALEEELNRIFSCEKPDPEEAIRQLEELLAIDPNFGPGWSKLAWAYSETGRHEDAEKAVITALALKPDDLQAEAVFLALPIFSSGDIEAMTRRLEQIVSENPKVALAKSLLGTAYMCVGRFTDALQVLNSAVNLAPNNPWCHYYISSIYGVALHHSTPPGIEELRRSTQLFREELGHLMSEEERQHMDAYLQHSMYDRYPQFANLTLEALGCTYEHARNMAEQHLRETMRLSKLHDLTEKAKVGLATLRMIDQMRRSHHE